jgi:uncharacterized protein YegP (UPF0339 family)
MNILRRLFHSKLYRIELVHGHGWFHRVVSIVNGQTVYTSEVYSSADKAMQTAESVASDAGWELRIL